MANANNNPAQREDINSPSGQKQRSPTSEARSGSRVEPSHLVSKDRADRDVKVARDAKADAKKSAPKKA